MNNDNQAVLALAESFIQWHESRVKNCNTVINNADADICLPLGDDGQECVIKAGSEQAKWLRIGVSLALFQFTPCPATLNRPAEMDDSEEDYDDE